MSEERNAATIEPWLRRIHANFLGMDKGRTPEEGFNSFWIAKKQLSSRGLGFSDIFLVASKEHLVEYDRKGEEIEELKAKIVAYQRKTEEQKTDLHKLFQEHWKSGQDSLALEKEAYEICCEYFRQVGRQPPPPPVFQEFTSPEFKKKDKKKREAPKMDEANQLSLVGELGNYLSDFDSSSPEVVNQAYSKFRALLILNGLLIVNVVMPKINAQMERVNNIEDAIFKRILLKDRFDEELEELEETYKAFHYQIKSIGAEIYDFEGRIAGAKHDISLWSKKLHDAKSGKTRSAVDPATLLQQFMNPHYTARSRQPSGGNPQSGPGGSSQRTRVVTPPPQQRHSNPTPSSGTTVLPQAQAGTTTGTTPPAAPQQQPPASTATKGDGFWTWLVKHPVYALALVTTLVFGGGYVAPKALNGDWASSSERGDLLLTGQEDQDQKYVKKDLYIAGDSVALWSNIDNQKGTHRVSKLAVGTLVKAEIPLEQRNINLTDKWVRVLSNEKAGYVFGKYLSATAPVVNPDGSISAEAYVEQPPASPSPAKRGRKNMKQRAPYKKEPSQAFICAGKKFAGTDKGVYVFIDEYTPIETCVGHYSVNGGRDTKLTICSYPVRKQKGARIFLMNLGGKDVYVPYSAVSLDPAACTQTRIIKGRQPTP